MQATPPAAPAPLPLSDLDAGADAPIYTIYAAPLERSSYLVDEGYQLRYQEADRPLAFVTDSAGEMTFAWESDGTSVDAIADYASPPRVRQSYASSGAISYRPLVGVEIEHGFSVYSSRALVHELAVTNAGDRSRTVTLHVGLWREQPLELQGLSADRARLRFGHAESLEAWSQGQPTGYQPDFVNALVASHPFERWVVGRDRPVVMAPASAPAAEASGKAQGIALAVTLSIAPGEAETLRLVRAVERASAGAGAVEQAAAELVARPLEPVLADSRARYAAIPRLAFDDRTTELVYWQAFSLMRQMMMPPEGLSTHQYYVFAREPTWGWGHDGQVFHESLALLAYAYMDPAGAMSSQRLFMDRQDPDGYVAYRAGPYVTMTFPVDGEKTSSAPFYAWTNWEIYRVTGDRSFLKEAYSSSRRYVEYMLATRDKDGDGLYSWGGHAVLECVRDGHNAVWRALGRGPNAPKKVEALDLSLMLASELRALALMAAELGLEEASSAWLDQYRKLAANINAVMWDEETGFYYHVGARTNSRTTADGVDLRRMEIIGFLAMWAGVAPPDRAERLLEHLRDPNKFWRRYGVPTLAADDPDYSASVESCCRWNGPVWLPWQYLVFRGLLDYDRVDLARELAARSTRAVTTQLGAHHIFFESFNPDSDQQPALGPYFWDGILARFWIDLDEIERAVGCTAATAGLCERLKQAR